MDGFQNLRPATNDTQKKTVKNDGELLRFQFAQWLGGTWFYLHDGKPKEFLDSTLSGTWTKRSFERFSARQPKKDNHPASDSSCLNNRRMLLLGSIGTFVSWSYIRAKTIIGIQQYQYNRPSRCGRFRRESTYDLEREFARVFAEGPAQSTCKNTTTNISTQQRAKNQQPTRNTPQTKKQQTTAATSTLRMQNTMRLQGYSNHEAVTPARGAFFKIQDTMRLRRSWQQKACNVQSLVILARRLSWHGQYLVVGGIGLSRLVAGAVFGDMGPTFWNWACTLNAMFSSLGSTGRNLGEQAGCWLMGSWLYHGQIMLGSYVPREMTSHDHQILLLATKNPFLILIIFYWTAPHCSICTYKHLYIYIYRHDDECIFACMHYLYILYIYLHMHIQ